MTVFGEWFGNVTIIFALNGGLSVANNHYNRFLLRRSEGKYKSVYYRKHNKAAFRR